MAFDSTLANLTVDLSKLAYRDQAAAEAGAAGLGLGGFEFFSGAVTTQAFAVDDAARSYLAFRGTEATNPRDWMTDAQFMPMATAMGHVHSGFESALDEIWNGITTRLSAETKPMVVTGHSLGGGLAILAAARLAQAGTPPAAVYVYGCPRTGLRDFRDAYDEQLGDVTFRIINHIDLVTRVPLLVQGYRAPGRRMYFDASHTFHADAGAWLIARDDLAYRLTHLGRISSLGLMPHDIGEYVSRVATL